MLKKVILGVFLLCLFSAGYTGLPSPAHASSPEAAIPDHLLVFFLDPDGGPCKLQVQILNQMADELKDKVLIRPVKTTVPEDRKLFYAYGIRALPTILLADSGGKEIRRLPPGVQQSDAISSLLTLIPKK